MSVRPIYVGMGSCRCGRTEVRLYEIPSDDRLPVLACARCLEAQGIAVPRPLTAADVSDKFLFGAPKEKKEPPR
jgi:hypothetical protein